MLYDRQIDDTGACRVDPEFLSEVVFLLFADVPLLNRPEVPYYS